VGSTKAGAASVTVSWTPGGGSTKSAVVAVPILPSACERWHNEHVFYANSRLLFPVPPYPSNNIITITNYITVTNGVMARKPGYKPPHSNIAARNIVTPFPTPVYSSANSNLVWSGSLPGQCHRPPPAQAITYVISNSQAGRDVPH